MKDLCEPCENFYRSPELADIKEDCCLSCGHLNDEVPCQVLSERLREAEMVWSEKLYSA